MVEKLKETRPWGEWEVLNVGEGYKVKKLTILPGRAISKQYHLHRSETWAIIQGKGLAIVDDAHMEVGVGDAFVVPVKGVHKVTCLSEVPLIAIEVQQGDITEEHDIVRVAK